DGGGARTAVAGGAHGILRPGGANVLGDSTAHLLVIELHLDDDGDAAMPVQHVAQRRDAEALSPEGKVTPLAAELPPRIDTRQLGCGPPCDRPGRIGGA